MSSCLGIEIGGSKLQLVRGTPSGEITQRQRWKVDRARGAEGIRAQIENGLPQLLSNDRLLRIGVGFGGPVNWRTGAICRSHQIEGWSDFQLRDWLRQITGVTAVSVDNDANVAALGEALNGAGAGFRTVFYVTLGSGVGGGLVQAGRIYHGAAPGECEIGHVRLDRAGACVESRCSGWAVDARIRALRTTEPQSVLCRLTEGMSGGEARHLPAALDEGDREAKRILEETAEDLAFGLSHAVHLLHPDVIILGGGLSELGDRLVSAVTRYLPGFLMEVLRPGPPIKLAQHREDAVPIGALCLSAEQQFV